MAELDVARNAPAPWALTRCEEAIGRPLRYYVNGIDAAFTADGQFKVFWNEGLIETVRLQYPRNAASHDAGVPRFRSTFPP